MSYYSKIKFLEESVMMLNGVMADAKSENNKEKVTETSAKIISYEEEIRRLKKLQFEEDTQTVYFDDDR